jgi:hypothetical protein
MINLRNLPQMILLHSYKVLIKIIMKKKMNTMIKFKRRAMIKGEMMMMAMMGIREKHHYIQECATMFKEITSLTAYLVISKNDKIMTDRFEMSMMGVLTFFLAFQIKRAKEGDIH